MTQPLLSYLGEVKTVLTRSAAIWVGTDFDGTLTHHQDDPFGVVLPERMRQRLATLAATPTVAVAVISGRSLSDLMPRVGLPNLAYAGNHGLEIHAPAMAADAIEWIDPQAMELQSDLVRFANEVRGFVQAIPGTTFDDKKLSLAIDYRPCPQPVRDGIVAMLNEVGPRYSRLRLRHSVFGSEVLPCQAGHKGTAAIKLHQHQLAGHGTAIYLGDDLTDEDAFQHLHEAITIFVGTRPTAAKYRVDSPDQVGEFLDWLVGVTKH